MDSRDTALILIGFQNDYFAPDGVLHDAIEAPAAVIGTLRNTVRLVEQLIPTPVLIISTPIIFTPDYRELVDPVGILRTIKEMGAFSAASRGADTVPELGRFGERIIEVPGKRGLNAFSNTELDNVLRSRGVREVVLAGVVTSICIDSTGRSAHERGYGVSILRDCTAGRTVFEQEFFCTEVFPLYARVITSPELLSALEVEPVRAPARLEN